jgi:hypothetical protein
MTVPIEVHSEVRVQYCERVCEGDAERDVVAGVSAHREAGGAVTTDRTTYEQVPLVRW